MKKVVSVTIEKEIWDFMENNFINKSAFVNSLIRQYYIKNNININHTSAPIGNCPQPNLAKGDKGEAPADILLEAEELINAPRTD